METQHTCIISTVGTSLLTNGADEETRRLLTKTANRAEADYDAADLDMVRQRIAAIRTALQQMTVPDIRRRSAELNAVFGLGLPAQETSHYLLCTDTLQGRSTADLVKEVLERQGCREVIVQPLERLTTANQEDFEAGITALLVWCDQTLPSLREQKARIIFNLSGSFKSLQAYAQTIGMIYADEICYVFEAPGSPLLRIPRLPLQFDSSPLRAHAALFARLATDREVTGIGELPDIPEAYLERVGDHAVLSRWGKLAWNSRKREILCESLIEQPGLIYENTFRKDFDDRLNSRVAIQETLAKVAVLWNEGGLAKLRADGGLQYEDMKKHPGIGHFRVDRGWRVSCRPDGKHLRLRHVGPHDYVNNNP
jgi:putative CRISPR-associated protein (TIGR02619 family)